MYCFYLIFSIISSPIIQIIQNNNIEYKRYLRAIFLDCFTSIFFFFLKIKYIKKYIIIKDIPALVSNIKYQMIHTVATDKMEGK